MGSVVGINRGGRPRLPTALKALKGTLAPSRENPLEPQLTPTRIGRAPAELSEDETVIWGALARAVNRLGVAVAGDLQAFEAMVCALAQAKLARRAGDLDGWAKADARWEKWASHFGLTPATRPKVNRLVDQAPKKDPLSEFG
jgi:hypothetical protein